jgi:hypothetical protein
LEEDVMVVLKRRLAGGLLAVVLAACSGKDTNRSGPNSLGGASGAAGAAGSASIGPSTPLEDVADVYAAALCSAYARCWTALIDATDGLRGCERLLGRLSEASLFRHITSAVDDGRISYHPEQLPACVRAIESATCAGYDDVVCPEIFVGSKLTGEACELDEECAGDAQCLVEDSCPGACGPRRALGNACSDANRCAAGLRCASSPDATRVCVEPAKLAEECGTYRPCAGLLFCAGAEAGSTELSGTCVERRLAHDGEEGAPCDGLGAETLCKLGLVCSFVQENGETVGRCQPSATAGGPCIYSMPDACPSDQYCHIDTELGVKPATGTCTPLPKLGEVCRYGTIHVARCGDGIEQVCHPDTDVCVAIKRLGEPCTSGQECATRDCDSSGHCAALLECEEAAAAM